MFFDGLIASAQKDCTVELANKMQELSNNYMQIIKVDLHELIRAFDAKVDKFLSIPAGVTGSGPIAGQIAAISDGVDGAEKAANKRLEELEMVYKQQALLLRKLRAELEFYDAVMDDQAEIDDGLCSLVEKCMQENSNELDGNERILEHLSKVLEAKNAEIEI